ncbi:unnamed protein product [Effrenium voratum]|uniref:Uncharacterized protein n=1 Tax=Effrenium voratum TaxID=2562239 RepID=A0AA36JE27_9DINO|nr:unnamed protein product [Effrenium voratum]
MAKGRSKREVVEALPPHDYLAKSKLFSFDLTGELQKVHAAEARRHLACLTTPPVGLVERKCPYGAPLKRKVRKVAVSQSQPVLLPLPEAEQPKRVPGLVLMEIPKDPTSLPSEHAERISHLESKIAEKELQELQLQDRRPERLAKLAKLARSASGVDFGFDRLPEGLASEAKTQYFARSPEIVRDIGCGKDSRFCRPWGPYEQHREAYWRQTQALQALQVGRGQCCASPGAGARGACESLGKRP